MTVAVAHQGTTDSDHVLLEAVREASARGESLAVIHVRRAVDEDLEAAVGAGVKDAIERVTAKAGVPPVPYELHVAAGTADDLAAPCSTRRMPSRLPSSSSAPGTARRSARLSSARCRSASSSRPTYPCLWSSPRADPPGRSRPGRPDAVGPRSSRARPYVHSRATARGFPFRPPPALGPSRRATAPGDTDTQLATQGCGPRQTEHTPLGNAGHDEGPGSPGGGAGPFGPAVGSPVSGGRSRATAR